MNVKTMDREPKTTWDSLNACTVTATTGALDSATKSADSKKIHSLMAKNARIAMKRMDATKNVDSGTTAKILRLTNATIEVANGMRSVDASIVDI